MRKLYSYSSLLLKRNLSHSEVPLQSIYPEDTRSEEKKPESKIRLEYAAKDPIEKVSHLERTKLFIKNMVSIRCKLVVKTVLENLELNYTTVELGEVEIIGNLSEANRELLKHDLSTYGLELMEEKKRILVEKMKMIIVEMIHYSEDLPDINFQII